MTRREALFSLGGLGGAGLFTQGRVNGVTSAAEVLPPFWKSRLADVDLALTRVQRGRVSMLAKSAGQRTLHLVSYGQKDELAATANYNSACGGEDPASYRRKDGKQKPVVFLLGPVHGGEIEGIVGLNNLIRVAETGQDLRGRKWPRLTVNLGRCRVLIVPVGNPDGRARCPADSWVGADEHTYERICMGTKLDGADYVWPAVKRYHPMRGAGVGTLGAYFNDAGVNLMHDEWFQPMADETRAFLRLAREEAPDFIVSLHSHESSPSVEPTAYVPHTVKETIRAFAERLYARYRAAGLPAVPGDRGQQRKQYRMTGAGRKYLLEQLRAFGPAESSDAAFLLRVAFFDVLPKEKREAVIAGRKAFLISRAAQFSQLRKRTPPRSFSAVALDRVETLVRDELRWIRSLEKQLLPEKEV